MPLAAIIVELENFTPPPPPLNVYEDRLHVGFTAESEQSISTTNPAIGSERFF